MRQRYRVRLNGRDLHFSMAISFLVIKAFLGVWLVLLVHHVSFHQRTLAGPILLYWIMQTRCAGSKQIHVMVMIVDEGR